MPTFSVLSKFSVVGSHVSCINPTLVSYSGQKLQFQLRKLQSLEIYRRLSAAVTLSGSCSKSISLVAYSCLCESQSGSLCCRRIRSSLDGNSKKSKTQLRNGCNPRLTKQFSLRLRTRMRLLSSRVKRLAVKLKQVSLWGILEAIGVSLRKNLKRVTVSTSVSVGLGFLYLLLKLTAAPSSEVVPYSDLVMNLQGGHVSKVLFEEGSHCIFYNLCQNPENSVAESAKDLSGTVNNPVSSRARVAAPEWQCCTRKIDHDEEFLLTLMREKGLTYRSAPQSPLVSLRSVLFTVVSLWTPLTPLMWLLYHQFSATNSLARK